jgi:general secretion pathway protein L
MSLQMIADPFRSWMNAVAQALVVGVGRMRSRRYLRLVEEAGGTFVIEMPGGLRSTGAPPERLRLVNGVLEGTPPAGVTAALRGSRIELILLPSRFLARPLELPKRAAEFLDGIVRAQIDRLTPWNVTDAAFGWTPPVALEGDRIRLTVVATARALIAPYLQALTALGAGSIVVRTFAPAGDVAAAPVEVLAHSTRHALDVQRVRRLLTAVLIGTALSTGGAIVAGGFVADALQSEQGAVSRRIAEQRASMRREGAASVTPALSVLERRKRETPASVIVVEELSKVLPDHTYVMELRVEGDKLQLIGITRDAPSLIRLIEQSPHFTRATFFAPTTRSSGDPGERFHIEARIRTVFGSPT